MLRTIAVVLLALLIESPSNAVDQQPEVEQPNSKRFWQAKLDSVPQGRLMDEFEWTVNNWRGFVPHVARSTFREHKNAGDWAWLDLDGDWTLASEMNVAVRLVGLPDLSEQIPPELYVAVRAIHRSPSLYCEFDPVNLIRAVNTLQAMGEVRAIKALKAYSILCEKEDVLGRYRLDPNRIVLLARLLYLPKDPTQPIRPPMFAATQSPPRLTAKKDSPLETLFPLAVESDIPFRLIPFRLDQGYRRVRLMEAPLEYLDYCRSAGSFRKRPLKPTSGPFDAASAIIAGRLASSAAMSDGSDLEWLKEDLRGQAVSAASNAIGNPSQWCTPGVICQCGKLQWESAIEKSRSVGTEWSEAAGDFIQTKQPKE